MIADNVELEFIKEIKTAWDLLKSSQEHNSVKIGAKIDGESLYLRIDENGAMHLLIPIHNVKIKNRIWQGNSLSLSVIGTGAGSTIEATWLDLFCYRQDLNEVFIRMAAYSISKLVDSSRENILSTLVSSLDEWTALLGANNIKQKPVIGMIGELVFLINLLELGVINAFEYWIGPEGSKHDFRNGKTAFEIKTSLQKRGTIVQIHGIEQLMKPENGILYLAFIRLERVPEGSLSLRNIINRLLALGVSKSSLERKIGLSNVEDSDNEDLNVGYEMVEMNLYPVDDDFPKIIPSSFRTQHLSPLVLGIQYSVDITSLLPLSESVAIQAMRNIVKAD